MTSKFFWLGSALCGALLVNGCSSSGTGDGGTTTTGGTTASVTSGTTGQASTSGSTNGSTSAGTTGAATTGTTTTGGTTGAVDAGVGTPCDATVTDTTCAPFGLFCQGVLISDGGFPGTCVLPIEQVACLPAVGCEPGFFCVAGVFAGGSFCVQSCQQSSDCQSLVNSCVPHVIAPNDAGCVPNVCGPGSTPANGTGYYSPCNGQATNDGICLPVSSTQAYCRQGGTVALNQPCSSTRVDGGGDLCQVGTTCVTLKINKAGVFGLYSACLAPCPIAPPTWSDGGPVCDSTSTCVQVFPTGLPTGFCFEKCLRASPSCPTPLVCLNTGDPTNGICGPG
jgi:hypothetical protein